MLSVLFNRKILIDDNSFAEYVENSAAQQAWRAAAEAELALVRQPGFCTKRQHDPDERLPGSTG